MVQGFSRDIRGNRLSLLGRGDLGRGHGDRGRSRVVAKVLLRELFRRSDRRE